MNNNNIEQVLVGFGDEAKEAVLGSELVKLLVGE